MSIRHLLENILTDDSVLGIIKGLGQGIVNLWRCLLSRLQRCDRAIAHRLGNA
ncbi:hypothetical protein OGM63_26765 [Plectonema radiosum NIES-515]|uniref:Uncharacterized protein n=1 Tax=Plectonema radiosum NIES-515 TaxID=2986073 RepID=A0ABT3B6Q9_9CYAN|nr:hypothetical protein [Plectonema radiosum NIES-515]